MKIAATHKNKDACIKRIAKKLGADNGSRIKKAQTEVNTIQTRLSDMDKRFDLLYEDRLNGTISETKFREITKRWEAEQEELHTKMESLQKQLSDVHDAEEGTRQFADLLDQYTQVEELNTELLNRLIDKIIIGERENRHSKKNVKQKIRILFKGFGELDDLMSV